MQSRQRSIRRAVFTSVSAVSFLSAITAMLGWPLSHFRPFERRFDASRANYYLSSMQGELKWSSHRYLDQFAELVPPPEPGEILAMPEERSGTNVIHPLFKWGHSLPGVSCGTYIAIEQFTSGPRLRVRGHWFAIQYTLLVPLLCVLPVIWFARYRRPIPPHCCQRCGYDLTGNVSGVCPECGAQEPDASMQTR